MGRSDLDCALGLEAYTYMGVIMLAHVMPYGRTLALLVRGATETLFSSERWREPRFAPVPLTLAHLLLFHRRLDG